MNGHHWGFSVNGSLDSSAITDMTRKSNNQYKWTLGLYTWFVWASGSICVWVWVWTAEWQFSNKIGNSVTKQLPNYHLAISEKVEWPMPFGHLIMFIQIWWMVIQRLFCHQIAILPFRLKLKRKRNLWYFENTYYREEVVWTGYIYHYRSV